MSRAFSARSAATVSSSAVSSTCKAAARQQHELKARETPFEAREVEGGLSAAAGLQSAADKRYEHMDMSTTCFSRSRSPIERIAL
eukprot:SAG11_NODE_6330_length_1335_cov_1.385113_1_plen_84_part_01